MQKLIDAAQLLPGISLEAARAYDSRKGLIVERVNLALDARSDLKELIGGLNMIEMMHDNHRNHAMFLTSVLHLNAFGLLASVVPWVYRTYHKHGFSYDYFPVALEAWKEAIRQEVGESEAMNIFPVYDWLLNHHEKIISLMTELDQKNESDENTGRENEFYNSLLEHDLHAAMKIGEKEFSRELDPRDFYENIARPAMYKIGRGWEKGELSVAQEHLATAMVQTIVANLQGKSLKTDYGRGRVLVASVAGELHDLGARMFAHSLSNDDWEVSFLGANTPINNLIGMAREVKPTFVGLSLVMPYYLHYLRKVLDSFSQDEELCKIPVMVGGLVFRLFPESRQYLPGAAIFNDIDAALAKAREWQNA
jgi:methanogenic corrinoid protein MtbC1